MMILQLSRVKTVLKKRLPFMYSYLKRLKKSNSQNYAKLLENRFVRKKPSKEELRAFESDVKNKVRVYTGSSKATGIQKLLNTVEIKSNNTRFFYSIDVFKMQPDIEQLMINSTIDYKFVIENSLKDLILKGEDHFSIEHNIVCRSLMSYLDRCVQYLMQSDHDNKDEIISWLSGMADSSAKSFEEALQRILFLNMVLWQTNHRLVGLGRLDYMLNTLYEQDKRAGKIDKEKATSMIMDFFTCLHQYYWFKSDALMGDTGQIVILGGKEADGTYFYNDLTWCFIEAVERLQKPDPKVLLRVAKNTPVELIERGMYSIETGVGNPLFSNDDVIIPSMIDFGYDEADAYNYVTSACWEPLIPGVAHEQNNIGLYNFLLPLQLISEKEDLSKINTFEDFYKLYCDHLCNHVDFVNHLLDEIKWESDPIISTFTQPCRDKHVDISNGGGKYNNYGVLSVAMSNTVNALMIVKKYVFEEKLFDLQFLDSARKENFDGHEDIYSFLKSKKYYGTDNDEAVEMTRAILKVTSDRISKYKNAFGGKIKFGLSSPGYIQDAKSFPASLDGRKNGEPFAVHISGDDNASFTELMQFASKLNYAENRFNGNVTDFFVAPNLMYHEERKFADFMLSSFNMGVFQSQINVVSSSTLIAARAEPEKFPNLIVRVWGFSAYYIELPDEYKDYLIQRALKCEGAA